MKFASPNHLFIFPESLMRQLGIAGIFLFGSQAQGIASETSDYDFGVIFSHPMILSDRKKHRHAYDALYDLLAPQIGKPVTIDIIFAHEADLQFRAHMVRDGILLYLGNPKVIGDFIEQTMEAHADFAPHRQLFHEAMLARMGQSPL